MIIKTKIIYLDYLKPELVKECTRDTASSTEIN